ncbi:GNAT family N-acetyltransferase [Paenibacillus rhizophilus]|uniref:GNAT family N-acetyltransferase n=1 Tax=Paenibacillus rhizophilus TaxID=1850366 RepID=A0A3N9PC08_9BACL|nr:GNAT family N-acetyltransferase [Paenibacillus rhizophilus]RQW13020.1 GNAT family N-acetyltransferase [Paenibacillus rhizophilus]
MAILHKQEYLSKSGIPVIIRSAVPADAAGILSVQRKVVEENRYVMTAPHEFHKTNEDYKELIDAAAGHPGELLLVAAANDTLAGWLILYTPSLEKRSHVREFGIMLSPDWRGLGIGKKLIATMLNWTASRPLIEKVCLEVFSSNENAIQLYRSLGFQEEGRRLKQIKLGPGSYVDLILMYKALK